MVRAKVRVDVASARIDQVLCVMIIDEPSVRNMYTKRYMRIMGMVAMLAVASFAKTQDLGGLLPIDKAYKVNAHVSAQGLVEVHWAIAPEYYLYRKQIKFAAGDGVTIGSVQLPPGTKFFDQYLGESEIYHKTIDVSIPYTLAPGTQRVKFSVRYQGCHEVAPKICYPPHVKEFDLQLPGGAVSSANRTSSAQGASSNAGASMASRRPETQGKARSAGNTLPSLIAAVDAAPNSVKANKALLEFESDEQTYDEKTGAVSAQSKRISSIIQKQYFELQRQYPQSAEIQWAIGMHFNRQEDPRATQHLLRYLKLDSNNAKAHALAHAEVYSMLASLANFRADKKSVQRYAHAASMLEPKNANYAAMDAASRDGTAALLDVARRFPGTMAASTAFLEASLRMSTDAERVRLYMRALAELLPYPNRSGYFAAQLYDFYLQRDPARSLKLAQQQLTVPDNLQNGWDWPRRKRLAKAYLEAMNLVKVGHAEKAVGLLDELKERARLSPNAAMLVRFSAQVLAAAGKQDEAYRELLQQQASAPDDETHSSLLRAGVLLHKSQEKVEADLKAARYANAKVAPSFDLKQYGADHSISLSQLRGKVVFLTFWYPGCGPCRAELPHLEAVVKQFSKSDVAFLGVNTMRSQGSDVLPFVTNGKHIFVPLEATDDVVSPDGYNITHNPMNFLIDKHGHIVYSDFMIDNAHDERVLHNMIESLL